MHAAALTLCLAAISMDVGYESDAHGGVRYIVHVPASQLEQLRRENPNQASLTSAVEPRLQGRITEVVIRITDAPAPRDASLLVAANDKQPMAAPKLVNEPKKKFGSMPNTNGIAATGVDDRSDDRSLKPANGGPPLPPLPNNSSGGSLSSGGNLRDIPPPLTNRAPTSNLPPAPPAQTRVGDVAARDPFSTASNTALQDGDRYQGDLQDTTIPSAARQNPGAALQNPGAALQNPGAVRQGSVPSLTQRSEQMVPAVSNPIGRDPTAGPYRSPVSTQPSTIPQSSNAAVRDNRWSSSGPVSGGAGSYGQVPQNIPQDLYPRRNRQGTFADDRFANDSITEDYVAGDSLAEGTMTNPRQFNPRDSFDESLRIAKGGAVDQKSPSDDVGPTTSAATGTKIRRDQFLLNCLLMLSLVMNAYLGVVLYKLYLRYRSLVSNVRGYEPSAT
jgi:hypothetical protein